MNNMAYQVIISTIHCTVNLCEFKVKEKEFRFLNALNNISYCNTMVTTNKYTYTLSHAPVFHLPYLFTMYFINPIAFIGLYVYPTPRSYQNAYLLPM